MTAVHSAVTAIRSSGAGRFLDGGPCVAGARELVLSGTLLAIYASARATAIALSAAQRLIV